MKEFKHDDDWFDPLGDKMAAVVAILLVVTILFVAIVTTKFVYEGGGIWPATGWVGRMDSLFCIISMGSKKSLK